MKTLKLKKEPVFPLAVYKKPKAREQWIKDVSFNKAFRAEWYGGSATYRALKPPETVVNGRAVRLVFHGEEIFPLCEVWERVGQAENLCRLWFQVGDKRYEACKINGWNPKPELPPFISNKPSSEAWRIAVLCAGRV